MLTIYGDYVPDRKFTNRREKVSYRGREWDLEIYRYRGGWFAVHKHLYQLRLMDRNETVAVVLTNGFVVRKFPRFLPLAAETHENYRNLGLITFLIKQAIPFFKSEGFRGFQISIKKDNTASLTAAHKIGFLEEPLPHETHLNFILNF